MWDIDKLWQESWCYWGILYIQMCISTRTCFMIHHFISGYRPPIPFSKKLKNYHYLISLRAWCLQTHYKSYYTVPTSILLRKSWWKFKHRYSMNHCTQPILAKLLSTVLLLSTGAPRNMAKALIRGHQLQETIFKGGSMASKIWLPLKKCHYVGLHYHNVIGNIS